MNHQDKLAVNKLLNFIDSCSYWDSLDPEKLEHQLEVLHAKAKYVLKKLNIPCRILNKDIENEF